MTEYIRTDEQYDVLVSLREVHHQLGRVEAEPDCWKWVLLAAMSAVTGAMVCNLTGTMGVGALKKRDALAMIGFHNAQETGERPADPWLASPGELLARVRGGKRFETAGPVISVTVAQVASFKRVRELRDAFVHVKPAGWAIPIPGLPRMLCDIVSITAAIADDGWSLRHLDEAGLGEVQDLCARLRREFSSMVER